MRPSAGCEPARCRANPPPAIGTFTTYFEDNSFTDLLLALTWGGSKLTGTKSWDKAAEEA
jgi:hypothetical protein